MFLYLLFSLTAISNYTAVETTTDQANLFDTYLSASQLIASALHDYQLTESDVLIIKLTTSLTQQINISLPKRTSRLSSEEFTIPFESDNYKNQGGRIIFSKMMDDITLNIEKLSAKKGIKNAATKPNPTCGDLAINSRIEISLSNCTIGTTTSTYVCQHENNHSRWLQASSDKTPVSFAHKCIAPTK